MKVFMFHYVKPFSNYHHFNLKSFEKIILYMKQNYNIISLKEYDELIMNNKVILNDCVMLTFDDGTIDHYKYVFPILKKYGCSGLFFVTSSVENKVLDIQIIHKLLEFVSIDILYDELKLILSQKKISINEFEINNSLDDGKVAIFKQLLQFKLPDNIRNELLMYFSEKYKIKIDPKHYYISIDKMKKMKSDNMYFGIHTCTHPRLSLVTKELQKKEIENNLKFLQRYNLIDKNLYSIAFPYGSYSKDTIDIMKELNIKYGFKANSEPSDFNCSRLLIDRIDCNVLRGVINE